eukprot:2851246-Prorocentrum_lima.AAC.1
MGSVPSAAAKASCVSSGNRRGTYRPQNHWAEAAKKLLEWSQLIGRAVGCAWLKPQGSAWH